MSQSWLQGFTLPLRNIVSLIKICALFWACAYLAMYESSLLIFMYFALFFWLVFHNQHSCNGYPRLWVVISFCVAFVGSVCCSLVVLSVPSLSPPLNNCLSTELSGSSVTGAWGGLGAGGSCLGCGLGRPVGCSSAFGLWLRLQPPGFLGTHPPLATWALTTRTFRIFLISIQGLRNHNKTGCN